MAEEIKFFKVKDHNSVGTTNGIYLIKKDLSDNFELMVIDKGSKKFSEYVSKSKSNTVTSSFSVQQEGGRYISIGLNGLQVSYGGVITTYGEHSISVDNLVPGASYKFQELLFPKRAVKNIEEKVYPVTYVQNIKADETGRVDISNIDVNWTGSHVFSNSIVATSFYESSLRRYKTNIRPYEREALDVVDEIKVVTFDRMDSDIKDKIGVIADDSPKDILSKTGKEVDLYKTIFVLTKAVQELNSKIKHLEGIVK